MKTFRCTFGADVFAWLFELVIEKDILKLGDGQYYEALYACCTFNTRRQNSRKGLTRIQLAPAARPTFPKIGALIGSMWRLICPKFLATPDRPILSTHP
jgi:hypothetical protein